MRTARSAGVAALLVSSLLTTVASAAIFPDVPDEHVYREAIERLVGLKVINGNPDGRFHPERAVNRAEMLTMLYRSLNRSPELGGTHCFPDVRGWYEAVVCDAAAQRFVEGYNDGRFRPEKEVNRVEALKMIMKMFDIPVSELSQQMKNVVKFVDVSLSAWYTKYLYAAFTEGILPIAGQVGPRFYPDAPLLRGEAAAYIYNAMQALRMNEQPQPPMKETSTDEPMEEGGKTSRGGSTASVSPQSGPAPAMTTSSSSGPVIKEVDFPFGDDGTFTGKRSITYRFALKSVVTADVSVRLADASGKVSCRLFKLTDQGLSAEYYLGLQVRETCWMRVTLGAGSYQLDLQPMIADARFTLMTKQSKGDGNDGFVDAKILLKSTPRSGTLEVDDYADWYTFKVVKESTMTVMLSTGVQMDALIYPMEDVDLYGFSGPLANQSYLYPPGTYVVAVRRGDPKFGRLTYTLQLK